jgi:hypothetical protein
LIGLPSNREAPIGKIIIILIFVLSFGHSLKASDSSYAYSSSEEGYDQSTYSCHEGSSSSNEEHFNLGKEELKNSLRVQKPIRWSLIVNNGAAVIAGGASILTVVGNSKLECTSNSYLVGAGILSSISTTLIGISTVYKNEAEKISGSP